MSVRARSRFASSARADWAGATLAVLVISPLVLVVGWGVVQFVLLAWKDPLFVAIYLPIACTVMWGIVPVLNRANKRASEQKRRAWRLILRVARHDLDGYRELLSLLRRRTSRGSAVGLNNMSTRPALIDGLIYHARRGELRSELQPFADRVSRRVARPDPVAWALASLHADGHVREAAVARMAARPRPEYVPFLVERAVEWVAPVRGRALPALRTMLAEHADRYRPLVARELPRIAARRHAADVMTLFEPAEVSGRGGAAPGQVRASQ